METVKAGRHEECRAVDVAGKPERCVAVLVHLHHGKQEAEAHCQPEPPEDPLPVILDERVVGPRHRCSRQKKDERVEQRKMPRIERLDGCRRPCSAGLRDTSRLVCSVGEKCKSEIGPEPGDEEHHLGGDEQDHAVAQVKFHNGSLLAVKRLLRGVHPPARHGAEDHGKSHGENAPSGDIHPEKEKAVPGVPPHQGHGPDGHDERAERPREGPGTRLDNVVVVIGLA